jgi:hypothetical protein
MKRWTIRIFVFLLLGAIVNVAVACGCAIFVHARFEPFASGEWIPFPDNQQFWSAHAPESLADFRVHARPSVGAGVGVRSEVLWATNYMDGAVLDLATRGCNAHRVLGGRARRLGGKSGTGEWAAVAEAMVTTSAARG